MEQPLTPARVEFQVIDPFAETRYIRPTFEAITAMADKLGCRLVTQTWELGPLRVAIRRFRKDDNGQWHHEPPTTRPAFNNASPARRPLGQLPPHRI